MGLKDDLAEEVSAIFKGAWSQRDGTVVPDDVSLKLGNDSVKLSATVLYADMADSTTMVDSYKAPFCAEIYKTFLHCAAKVIKDESGVITAYDGDRIMAVFLGDSKNTSAVRAAMKLKWAVDEIINPTKTSTYKNNTFKTRHVVGIDTSELFVAKTGIRGANDLVWVGRAANYAAKLSSLPASYIYITKEVHSVLAEQAKISGDKSMWTPVRWNTFDDRIIYRSGYRWPIK
jgi:class 3 adenylate cyclase